MGLLKDEICKKQLRNQGRACYCEVCVDQTVWQPGTDGNCWWDITLLESKITLPSTGLRPVRYQEASRWHSVLPHIDPLQIPEGQTKCTGPLVFVPFSAQDKFQDPWVSPRVWLYPSITWALWSPMQNASLKIFSVFFYLTHLCLSAAPQVSDLSVRKTHATF